MIEIHTHILPNIDDGSKDINMSLSMIEDMIKNGIKGAVATPHHLCKSGTNPYNTVEELVNELNQIIIEKGLDFEVYPGQEIRLTDNLLDRLVSKDINGLNYSRYLLIEFPFSSVPMYSREVLFELISKGYIPIIAHPERIYPIQDNVDILREFINMGCLGQITASSILTNDKKLRNLSFEMIEDNLIHFIASDNHDLKRRNCQISKVLKKLEKLYDHSLIEYYINNSYKLINDENISKNLKIERKKSLVYNVIKKIIK